MDESKQSKGGKARAEKLSADERAKIARNAARARWPQQATHSGNIEIGHAKLPCAVLEDGTRVLSESGIAEALGSRSGGAKRLKYKARSEGRAPMPLFLASKRLEPFINNELLDGLTPIEYTLGKSRLFGYDANILPMICDVWLQANDAGILQPQQSGRVRKAEMLMRGLAQVGIIALVDEATGYQDVRDRQALQAILDLYLQKELAAWAKKFPDDFYKEMFRLRGWVWRGMKVNRPSVVGKYTNDLVYDRIEAGLLQELEKRNPIINKGRRKARHHQWLSEDVGNPALAQHLHAVIGLMRASATWNGFKRLINRAFPKKGNTLQLPLDDVDAA